ncbi:MFS general substrate transporter [Hyaloscypha variabilis]
MEKRDPINGESTSQEQLTSVVLTTSLSEEHISTNHEPQVPGKSLSFILAFTSLMATNFISIMDTVIVATALPAIAHGLNARSNEAYWAGSGFLFAQAVSQPLYGTLSTVFGRKDCLLFAMAIFTVASIFCATAQSMSWLITARVFQGLGSGGINAVGSIIVTDMVSLRERGKYIGILSVASALGLISGILIGAVVAGLSTWRLIFYINLPLCVPSIAGIYFFMNLKSELQSVRERLRQVDWTGMLILTASLISLLYGVTSGGVLQPWDSAVVIFTIVIGTCGITCFLLYEAYFAKEPMIPLRIFSSRTAGAAYISSFILGFVLWAMQYYLILYFLVAQSRSLLASGISILPGTVFVPLTAIAGGLIITKLQRFRSVNSIAWVFMTVGFSLMTQLRVESSKARQYGFQVIYAIGGGVLFPGRTCAVQASQMDVDVPMATAMVSFLTSLGESFGVGIGGVVFQNEWNRHVERATLSQIIAPEFVLSYKQAEQAASLIKFFPTHIQNVYRVIMADVIDVLFIVLAVFSGAAFLASLVSRNLSMDRETKSNQQFQEKKRIDTGGP